MSSRIGVWVQAARPKTLWAAFAPVAMGTALAWRDGAFHLPSALAALGGALAIQIGTNFCNDVADFKKGTDTKDRIGPVRAVAAGLVSPQAMIRATILAFVVAALIALYLVVRGGWPVALIGVLSIASGVLYTAGPRPLAYVGLGDVFSFIFFGPVAVAGTYYVQSLAFDWTPVVAGLAPGFLSVAILVVNNLRDVDGDARSGKKTLAVRFGRDFARWQYAACIFLAAAVPFVLVARFGAPVNSLAAGLILFAGMPAIRSIWSAEGAAQFDHLLAFTALLLLMFALLFSVGWVL